MLIKKGDVVEVISGDDRGKKGKVLRVFPKKGTLVVEGINYIHKHMKKSQKNPQGGRIDKEAPLNASKVMIFCSNCQKTTRGRFKFEVSEGKETTNKPQTEKIRCCSRCKGKI